MRTRLPQGEREVGIHVADLPLAELVLATVHPEPAEGNERFSLIIRTLRQAQRERKIADLPLEELVLL